MRTIPIVREGKAVGEASLRRERLYMRVEIHAPPQSGLWRAWLVGANGETLVGALDADGSISRRFSVRSLTPIGALQRAELRPAQASGAATVTDNAQASGAASIGTDAAQVTDNAQITPIRNDAPITDNAPTSDAPVTPVAESAWRRAARGQRLMSVRFQRQLRGVPDALTRIENGRRRVALLREDDAPFPIPELFCLASPTKIGARDYWVFSFDRREWPVL